MKTKNLNKHLFEKFGLSLTKEGLEEIVKIVIEENNNNCTITTGFELTHHRRSHKIRNSEKQFI